MFSYKSLFDVYDLRFPPYNAENALCSKFNAFPEAYFGLTLYVSLSSLLKFVVDIILLKILMPRNKQLQKFVCESWGGAIDFLPLSLVILRRLHSIFTKDSFAGSKYKWSKWGCDLEEVERCSRAAHVVLHTTLLLTITSDQPPPETHNFKLLLSCVFLYNQEESLNISWVLIYHISNPYLLHMESLGILEHLNAMPYY